MADDNAEKKNKPKLRLSRKAPLDGSASEAPAPESKGPTPSEQSTAKPTPITRTKETLQKRPTGLVDTIVGGLMPSEPAPKSAASADATGTKADDFVPRPGCSDRSRAQCPAH
jgi:hypothetical protein